LEKWLNDLSVAVEKNVFKLQTKEKILSFFTEAREEKPTGIVGSIYGKLKSDLT